MSHIISRVKQKLNSKEEAKVIANFKADFDLAITAESKNNVEIIPGGGHLISMSHAEEVANFINKNSS